MPIMKSLKTGIVGISVAAVLCVAVDAFAETAQWEAYTCYAVGDVVSYEGSEYEAIQAHTALPGWEPPNVLALWEKLPGNSMDWEVQVYYAVGDVATYGDYLYEAIQAHTALPGWEPPNVPALWEEVGPVVCPSSSAPSGYSEEEWVSLLTRVVAQAEPVAVGGIDVYPVVVDEPLVFGEGRHLVEFVELEAEEMQSLGVSPGDLAPGSDESTTRVYAAGGYESDTGITAELPPGTPSYQVPGLDGATQTFYCPSPYYCQLWNNVNGSGLQVGKNTFVEIEARSMGGAAGDPERDGEVCFAGGSCLPVRFCGENAIASLTTSFSWVEHYVVPGSFGGQVELVWFVASPMTWVTEGEDAFDDMQIHGPSDVGANNIEISAVDVIHNGYRLLNDTFGAPYLLDGANPDRDLWPALDAWKSAKLYGTTHPSIEIAVDDWAQGGHIKYPVVAEQKDKFDNHWAPIAWCSEFASWVFRQTDHCLGNDPRCANPMHIPELGEPRHPNDPNFPSKPSYKPDNISVFDFFNWADAVGWRVFFGDNSSHQQNGASTAVDPVQLVSDWSLLANAVDAGDYVGFHQCKSAACVGGDWAVHSAVVIGWSDGDLEAGNPVGPNWFDENRSYNFLRTISGNVGGTTGRVIIRDYTVCAEQVQNPITNLWNDPAIPDLDGDGKVDSNETCQIKLWDSHVGNIEDEGDFFILMP